MQRERGVSSPWLGGKLNLQRELLWVMFMANLYHGLDWHNVIWLLPLLLLSFYIVSTKYFKTSLFGDQCGLIVASVHLLAAAGEVGEACQITDGISLALSSTIPHGRASLKPLISGNPNGDQLVCPKYLCKSGCLCCRRGNLCKFGMLIVTYIDLHILTSCGLRPLKERTDCRNTSVCPMVCLSCCISCLSNQWTHSSREYKINLQNES